MIQNNPIIPLLDILIKVQFENNIAESWIKPTPVLLNAVRLMNVEL